MKKILFFVSIFSIITHYSMSFAQENETFGLIPVKAIHTFSTNEASQLRSSLPQSYDFETIILSYPLAVKEKQILAGQ